MQVKLNTKIGSAIIQNSGKAATVRDVIKDVLATRQEKDPCDGEFSSKLFDLHERIACAVEAVDLSFAELTAIRERVAEAPNHSHYVIGFMLRYLPFDERAIPAEVKAI